MKLIAVLGSPRGIKGYTGSLVQCVLDGARQAGAETELFSLQELLVLPCKGCLEICHIKGACHQRDDFAKIEDAMIRADGIIYASPNYNLTVSAQMKALFDRGNLLLHCQKLRGKYAATVVTSGGSDPQDVENYFKSILKLYGFWMVGGVSAVEAQFEDAEEKAKIMESAADLGRRMVTAVKTGERFPGQEDDYAQSFEIMKYMVMMLKERWPVAWNYWNTQWEVKE